MVGHSRYNVGGDESDITKNKLNITNQKTLEDTEIILLSDTYSCFFTLLKKKELTFDAQLVFRIHEYFLGTLYSWAGKIRSVNISKEGMLFARPQNIKNSIKEFEKILKSNLPSGAETKKELAAKMVERFAFFLI